MCAHRLENSLSKAGCVKSALFQKLFRVDTRYLGTENLKHNEGLCYNLKQHTNQKLMCSRKEVYMSERPVLDRNLDSKTFRDFYYLKEELVSFCKENGIPISGGKIEIADRIAYFLDTGKVLSAPRARKKATAISTISEDTKIEANFVCSEKHRAFFREHIGSGFSFNVAFQKWLKNNTGKTYREALAAYYQILEDKKKGKSLEEAIKCWKYKKQLQGHNRYERTDLIAIE